MPDRSHHQGSDCFASFFLHRNEVSQARLPLQHWLLMTFYHESKNNQPWIEKSDGGTDKNGEIRCIRVTNELTGEKILCNTEGYDYCQYVAIEGEELKDEQQITK